MADQTGSAPAGGQSGDAAADIAWLRAHGVTVETPEDRRRVQQRAADGGVAGGEEITCVWVPADDALPLQEIRVSVGVGSDGKDPFTTALSTRFADGKSVQSELVAQQLQGVVGGDGKLQKESAAAAVQKLAAAGCCEPFVLSRPCDGNGQSQVALYVDEIGALKALPLNSRAAALASACGFEPPPPFHGDVCAARLRGPLGGARRPANFTMDDAEPDAVWRREAAAVNAHAVATAPDSTAADPGQWAAVSEGVQWRQEGSEVEVSVGVPEATRGKELAVVIKSTELSVRLRNVELLSGRLHAAIRPDDSSWSLDRGKERTAVLLQLERVVDERWPALLQTAPAAGGAGAGMDL